MLFSPLSLGKISLANRIVMAPMTRSRAVNPERKATELIAAYYAQRATAGLIITEGSFVSPEATGYIHVPGIYTQPQIEGWKQTTDAVHACGGKIFLQLWHTGRISHPDFHKGHPPVAPSAINPNIISYTPLGKKPTVTPLSMGQETITQTILDFKNAAGNAMKAGFDGIELHAANGYLFHQFFMKCANIREDQYGGSIENRSRFLFEVLDAIGQIMDLQRVGVRLHPTLDDSFGIRSDETTGATFEYIVRRLNNYQLAYLHLSGFSKGVQQPGSDEIIETARQYRKLYKGALMVNKGFTAETAERVLQDGLADLVSFGSLFIANPDLVNRFKNKLPLNIPDRKTYYTPGAKGLTDYPTWHLGD